MNSLICRILQDDKIGSSYGYLLMKKFIFCLFILSFAINLSADDTISIDLLRQDIYVKKGFSSDWISRIPDDTLWKKFPADNSKIIRLSIPELKISGFPERKWFSLSSYKPELATIVIPFQFDQSKYPYKVYGLFFAYMGGCWEVYLNGQLIKDEFHLDENGEIDYITNSRNIVIALPPQTLRAGTNLLAVKIFGDPTFIKTGIYQNWPNIISDIESVYRLHSETISIILISIYLIIGMYHLFLFALRQTEKYNLYFGLLCLFLFINQFARTASIYHILTDTRLINRLELIFLYTLLPLIGLFIDSILSGKIKTYTYIYGAISSLFLIATISMPMPFVYDLVRFWEMFIALPALIIIVFTLVLDVKKNINGNNSRLISTDSGIFLKSVKGLTHTISGRFLFALMILVICITLDIVLKRYYYMHINPARYGFLVMVIVTTLNLAENFIDIQRRAETLNITLNENISDLNNAYEKISISEEKYRMLIEGGNHYICTTDLDGNLLTANNKLIHDQKLDPDDLGSVNILDLFYIPLDNMGVTRRFISEKIDETVKEKKQVSFKTKMKPYYQIEARDITVYFEIVNIASAQEILVKAYDAMEDSLLENMVCEKQVLEMGNSLSVAEEISDRLVRNVPRYYDPKKTTLLRIALREMLLNSIEHGNLDISYHIKSEILDNDRYFEFIARRQEDPKFRDKKIFIEYNLTPERVVYVIKDDGNGFDHKNMIDNALSMSNENLLSHGRGISMTMNVFDEVIYNDKGNEVRLVKYFKERPETV